MLFPSELHNLSTLLTIKNIYNVLKAKQKNARLKEQTCMMIQFGLAPLTSLPRYSQKIISQEQATKP